MGRRLNLNPCHRLEAEHVLIQVKNSRVCAADFAASRETAKKSLVYILHHELSSNLMFLLFFIIFPNVKTESSLIRNLNLICKKKFCF